MSQPSDSEAIFELAKELAVLAGDEGNEIKLRSAVSRAYYTAFLLARDKLKVTTDVDAHAEVIRQVARRSKIVGDTLYNLKEYRRSADYHFPPSEEHKDWKENWNWVALKTQHLLERFKTW